MNPLSLAMIPIGPDIFLAISSVWVFQLSLLSIVRPRYLTVVDGAADIKLHVVCE